MITVKGKADADLTIISHIIDPSAPNVEFKNVTFDCKTIKDESGHIFVRQKAGEWVDKDGKIVCSLCGNSVSFSMIENSWRLGRFCQTCGAKMGDNNHDAD